MKNVIPWDQLIYFNGNSNSELGRKILRQLSEYAGSNLQFSHINFAEFSDGESDDKIPNFQNLKDKVVIFHQSFYKAKYVEELLDLVWASKYQYQAKYVIAVVPFMRYRRQDHPEKPEEINRNRKLIHELKYHGVDYLIVATPHSKEMADNCEEFGVRFREASPSEIFANTLRTILPPPEENRTFVYAPDQGSIAGAIKVAKLLEAGVLFSLKERGFNNASTVIKADRDKIKKIKQRYPFFPNLNYATGELVKDTAIVMVDDEISSGTTANDTGRLLKDCGAEQIYFAATHAVCIAGWKRKLFYLDPFDKVIISDTIPRDNRQRTGGRMHDVSMHGPLASELYMALREIFTKKIV